MWLIKETLKTGAAWFYTVLTSYPGCVKAVSIFWIRNSLWTCYLVNVSERNFTLWLQVLHPDSYDSADIMAVGDGQLSFLQGSSIPRHPRLWVSSSLLVPVLLFFRGHCWFPLLSSPKLHTSFPSCPAVKLVFIICLGNRLLTLVNF